MIASRSLLLAAICLVLILQSTLVSGRRKEKRPRHKFHVVHNVSCEGVVRNKFTVNLEMDEVYEFATMGDKKKKCTVRYKAGHCMQIQINTTFLNLKDEGSRFIIDAPDVPALEGVMNNDEHSPNFVNIEATELEGQDFEIRFESGKESVGKLSQVTAEIKCLRGISMKPAEERGDCQCGLIKPNMMMEMEGDDPRDHNRNKRSLETGEVEIEMPWMKYNEDTKSVVVTIGDMYGLSFMAPPEEGETPAALPDGTTQIDNTQFVLHINTEADPNAPPPFNETHQPACLGKVFNLRDLDNEKVFVIKMEKIDDVPTGKMHAIPMKVMDRYDCAEVLRKSLGEDDLVIGDFEGCLRPHRKSKLCEDSIGSPIFAFTNRKKTNVKLVGFVSELIGECAKRKQPAYFARLNNPGLAAVYSKIDAMEGAPLLKTCPDHPVMHNCAYEDGETFFCANGCCGHECCEECIVEATNETLICTPENMESCCITCPMGQGFTYCGDQEGCCDNGSIDGCCQVCNGNACDDPSAACRASDGECQPMCGGSPCDGECCANDGDLCCKVCNGITCDNSLHDCSGTDGACSL